MGYMRRMSGLLGLRKSGDRRRARRYEAPRGCRILVIDDSKTVVKILSRMLSQNEYEPIAAGDAESGLQLARQYPPDLIFLDILLPGMNGFAALRRLRQDPATAEVPVIMISGDEQSMARMVLDRLGSDDFMKKPFGRAEVFTRIEGLVRSGRLPARSQPSAFDWHAL